MTDETTPHAQHSRGQVLAAVSNEMVGLMRQYYGRGPTRARTLIVEDIVIVRMLDPFTTAERTLIDLGRRDEVERMRRAFQYEMRAAFIEVIERLIGRRVVTFLSEIAVDPDMAVELFFLEGGMLSRSDGRPPV